MSIAQPPIWHAIRFEPTELLEHEALQQFATQAMRFTSMVSIAQPCSLLLETGASLRYFGGIDALERLIRQAFSLASMAAAPTPKAALMFSAWQDGLRCTDPALLPERLGRLPVRLLDAAEPQIEMLESAGLRRIAALLALPRPAIARRFGQALLEELDAALGQRADPRLRHTPPPGFARQLELAANVESAPALGHAAGFLVDRLCIWLQACRLAARSFVLTIGHDDRPDTLLRIALATPAWQAQRLKGLLNEHLQRAILAAPATHLSLHCTELDVSRAESASLFPEPAATAEAIAPLLERLQARLGPAQVRQLALHADHRPEAAWQTREVDLAHLRKPRRTTEPTQRALPIPGLPRPLWLLASPQVLHERQGRPCRDGPLSLLAGPERIESGWWDGKPVQRDYFVAEDPQHRLLWIFRERLHNDGAGGWFLHGCFG